MRPRAGALEGAGPVRPGRLHEAAPAKINLALHVTGRRADGYHELDSLVVFLPGAADHLDLERVDEGREDTLTLSGPFAGALEAEPNNLILRALAHARARLGTLRVVLPPLRATLDKHLPVAAGIGGGSADAAAALRLAARLAAGPGLTEAQAVACVGAGCEAFGADVPVCLTGRPSRMSGIGDSLDPLPALPELALVLVNPGVPVATGPIFQALAGRFGPPLPRAESAVWRDAGALLAHLAACRNDLQAPAMALCPPIGEALAALRANGAGLARMSGSGATVFGLFEDPDAAAQAADTLADAHPDWWVRDGTVPASGTRPSVLKEPA